MAYTLLAFSRETFERGYDIPRYEGIGELYQTYSNLKSSINQIFEGAERFEDFEALSVFLNRRFREVDFENNNDPFSKFVSDFREMWGEFGEALPERVEGFNFRHLLSELDVNTFWEDVEHRTVDNLMISGKLVSSIMDVVIFFRDRDTYQSEFINKQNRDVMRFDHPLNLQYYVEKGAEIINYTWNSLSKRIFRILRSLTKGIGYIIHSHYAIKLYDLEPWDNKLLAFAEYGYGSFPKRGFKLNVSVPDYPISDNRTGLFHICAGLGGSILERGSALILSFSGTHTAGPYKWGDLISDFCQIKCTFPNYLGAVKILDELCSTLGGNYLYIVVVGHSLGGGLSQYAFGYNTNKYKSLYGFGFNSAGLSKPNFSNVKKYVGDGKFTHVFIDNDWVHQYGNHIGAVMELPHTPGYSRYKSHRIDSLFEVIGGECHCEVQ